MYRQDEQKELKKKWEQISRKGFKGYNFKDFQKDVFLLINDNVLYRDDVCEMLASQLRKVYQTIIVTRPVVSNLALTSAETVKMVPELISLTGLMKKFKEKI